MEKSSKQNDTASTLLVLGAAVLWGSMGIFVRHFNRLGLGAMDVVLIRVAVAAVLFPAVVAVLRPASFRVRPGDLWIFAGTGLVSIAMFSFCYFKTIALTSMSVAAVLLYTAPVMVVLMSALFFRERITLSRGLACLLAFGGCILVGSPTGASLSSTALITGLLAAFGYALYSIFSRIALNRGYHPFTILLYTFWIALLGVMPFADLPGIAGVLAAQGWQGWAVGLLMGLLTAVLPYAFYTRGLAGMEAGRASVMASLEPVTAAALGAAVFHEIPSGTELFGMVLVLAGVVVLDVRFKKV